MIRSISQIGALWPLCKNCGHIAQQHSDPDICGELTQAQCPHCNTWVKIPCQCREYKGMTYQEWYALLTEEEINKYGYKPWCGFCQGPCKGTHYVSSATFGY